MEEKGVVVKKKVNKRQVQIKVEAYYHLVNENNRLAATECLLVDINGVIARGISLCSKNDQFSRKKGRNYALRYALRALKGRPCEFNRKEAKELLNKIPMFKWVSVKKGEIDPALTVFESELIHKSRVNCVVY